jgi:DUF971 family protein
MRPTKIQVSKSNATLNIIWEDGSYSEYPLAGLRAACPCAECRGGHENMVTRGSPEMLKAPLMAGVSSQLERVDMVGNYAIQLVWDDGHSYGIYSWEFLKGLNPGEMMEGGIDQSSG